MADRFIVVEGANTAYGCTPARRLGDKSVFVIFDTFYGGPPSSSHASTTLRSVADLHCRALNAYARDPRVFCGGVRCSQLCNLPCDDPAHRRPNPPMVDLGSNPTWDPCRKCDAATLRIADRDGVPAWVCWRCGNVTQLWALSQEKGT